MLQLYQVVELLFFFSDRLQYYAGDLAAPRLGLSAADFASLAAHVDAVLHVAAYVSHSMTYASMKSANVGSTRELASWEYGHAPSEKKVRRAATRA